MKTKSIWILYILAAAVLVVLREVPFTGYENDGVYYMLAAKPATVLEIPPPIYGAGMGMPLAIWMAGKIIPDPFLAAKLISVLAGFLFLVSSMKAVQEIFSPFEGALTGLFLVLNPWFLIHSTTSLSDMLGAALPVAALCILLRHASGRSIFFASIILGLSWSVRSVNLVFWVFLLIPWKAGFPKGKLLIIAASGILLGMLPDAFPKWVHYHNPFYSENWRNLAANFYDWDAALSLPSFWTFARERSTQLLLKTMETLTGRFPILIWHAALLPAVPAFLGFFSAFGSAARAQALQLWIAALLVYSVLIASLWQVELRYFLPMLPVLFACGVFAWRGVAKNPKWMAAGLVLAVLLSGASAAKNLRMFLRYHQEPELKEAGLYIKEHSSAGETVLSRRPHVFFYAGLPGKALEDLPHNTRENIAAYVHEKSFSWIALENSGGMTLGEPVFKNSKIQVWRIKQGPKI